MSSPRYLRPRVPADLANPSGVVGFERASGVEEAIRRYFVDPRGVFYDKEHEHLKDASIGVLWAGSRAFSKGTEKAGTAQLVKPLAEPRTWGDAIRHLFHVTHFGADTLDFLIILSGPVCAAYDDRQFFALLDHELLHCGVQRAFGAVKYNEETGRPMWQLRPHDHEGFAGTIHRWGAHAAGAASLVEAGSSQARFSWVPGTDLDVHKACGKP